MKYIVTLFSLLIMTISALAQEQHASENYLFYIKVDSGLSIAQSPDITAPYPPWEPATQGYNASLGNCAIAGFTVGCEFLHILDLEVSISNRSIFQYQQYQTPTTGNESYTREFDLSVTPILFSANLLGRGIPHLNLEINHGKIYPIFGAGVGMSNLLITNYRTIGLPPTGSSYPYNSFSSGNLYTLQKNVTYTILAGFEYSHGDRWAMSTGYRWFNAGNFKGPQYLRTESGAAVDVGNNQWSMRFRAQEWFIELKIFI